MTFPFPFISPVAAAGGGPVNSCDFDGVGDYLSKTFGAGDGGGKKWSFFTWLKPTAGLGGVFPMILSANSGTGTRFLIYVDNVARLSVQVAGTNYTSTSTLTLNTWDAVGLVADTDNATAADRLKMYFNGSEVSWSGGAPPISSGQNLYVGTAVPHFIAYLVGSAGSQYYEGFAAQTTVLDNITADMTLGGDFLESNGSPKGYSGGYGTNGFHLDYEASGSLGDDVSGNSNDFATNGNPAQSSDVPT